MFVEQGGLLHMMEAEVARLRSAEGHLVRSNAELRAAIQHEGDEGRQFQLAIEVRVGRCWSSRACSAGIKVQAQV